MKNATLLLASILTTAFLLSQPVFAMPDGAPASAGLKGDNPADAIVPDGAGLPLDGFDCNTCRAHADRVERFDEDGKYTDTIPREVSAKDAKQPGRSRSGLRN